MKKPSEKACRAILKEFEAERTSWKWSEVEARALALDAFAAEAVSNVADCPQRAGGHQWDRDGQCTSCAKYATDLMDAIRARGNERPR